MTLTPVNTGWIELICGPMFSGKTEELIRRLIRSKIAKQRVAIFKPAIDNRYSDENIVSHNKRSIPSRIVENAVDILKLSGEAQVIGVDEAQFFGPEVVDVVKQLANAGNRVVVAGLEKDYLAKPFGSMDRLMIEAEYISKVLAICMDCGEPANFTFRTVQDAHQILVGESDKYEALCRNCYHKKMKEHYDA